MLPTKNVTKDAPSSVTSFVTSSVPRRTRLTSLTRQTSPPGIIYTLVREHP